MNTYRLLLFFTFVLVCGCYENTSRNNLSKTNSPTEILIPRNVYLEIQARELLIINLRKEQLNPSGYKFYITERTKDDYGNFSNTKSYVGGVIKVSQEYYDEIRKFNKLTDITEKPFWGVDDLGTEKGYKLFEKVQKCFKNYWLLRERNEVCFLTLSD